MVTIIEKPGDFANHVGQSLGVSEWLTMDQATIDAFAELTGDKQWIHVDPERAKSDMPGGKTIAHGYLTLSMMPRLGPLFQVEKRSRALNYGLDRLRFTGAVPAGSRIRLQQNVKAVTPVEGGQRIELDCVIEVEGQQKPALVATQIVAFYD